MTWCQIYANIVHVITAHPWIHVVMVNMCVYGVSCCYTVGPSFKMCKYSWCWLRDNAYAFKSKHKEYYSYLELPSKMPIYAEKYAICALCCNMRNMWQSHIRIKLTGLVYSSFGVSLRHFLACHGLVCFPEMRPFKCSCQLDWAYMPCWNISTQTWRLCRPPDVVLLSFYTSLCWDVISSPSFSLAFHHPL